MTTSHSDPDVSHSVSGYRVGGLGDNDLHYRSGSIRETTDEINDIFSAGNITMRTKKECSVCTMDVCMLYTLCDLSMNVCTSCMHRDSNLLSTHLEYLSTTSPDVSMTHTQSLLIILIFFLMQLEN